MNREQFQRLEELEELLERNDKRFSEQLSTFGRAWNMLAEYYEGDGADEMDEMHQQLITQLVAYEEQQRALIKHASTLLGNGHES